MVKRDREIGLKLTQDEYEHISRMAENDADTRWKSGKKNLSAYIRKCVLQSTDKKGAGQAYLSDPKDWSKCESGNEKNQL